MEIDFRSGKTSALWKEGIASVYLFFGEEDRLKQEATDALAKRVVEAGFEDFDLETLDAGSVTAESILSAANQAPFGSERRLVVVRGMEQWRDKNRQSEAERLAEGIAKLGASSCLILVAAAEEDDEKRKTAVTVKLDNAVKKAGVVVSCRALKGEGLSDWVAERVKQEGKKIAPEAIAMLIGSVGNEMLSLEQEIIKLVCYVDPRPNIVAADVGAVTSASPEDVVFSLIDAIVRKETDRALLLLAEVHRYDPKPQAVAGKLLALLARQYRMLWQAKFLAGRKLNPRDVRAMPPEMANELPTEGNIAQVAFKAGEIFGLSRNYDWDSLTLALERLLLCDLANKGGATDEGGVFGADPGGNLRLLVLLLTGATERPTGKRAILS